MKIIDVDLEVYTNLVQRQNSDNTSSNSVIRHLLGMCRTKENLILGWRTKNVLFPNESKLKATYKGKQYQGIIQNQKLVVQGKVYSSLSAAAYDITQTQVNGWKFWKIKIPDDHWRDAQYFMQFRNVL